MIQRLLLVVISFFLGIGGGLLYLQTSLPVNIILPIGNETIPKNIKGERIGFLPYWLVDKAQPSYKGSLTNLSYFSLTINPDGRIQTKVNAREEEPGWTSLRKESVKNHLSQAKKDGLTTSLTVFAAKESDIDNLLSNPIQNANNLLDDVLPIMKEYKFDDLNLDIESLVEASASSQQQFTAFTRTLKDRLTRENMGTLTVDVTVMSLFQSQRINPLDIGAIADRIVLMTYDYSYAGSILTGAVSPLHGANIDKYNDVTLSINKALETIPSEKLLMGIPLYGYEWETLNEDIGSAVIPKTGQTASNRRVEELLSTCTNCTKLTDNTSGEPYVTFSKGSLFHQLVYTNTTSIQNKLNYINSKNILGAAYWALGYEVDQTLPKF